MITIMTVEDFLKDDLNIDIEEFGAFLVVVFGYRKQEPREK